MYLCSKHVSMSEVRSLFIAGIFIFLISATSIVLVACDKSSKNELTSLVPVNKVFEFKTAKVIFLKTPTEWIMDVVVPKNSEKQLYYFEVKFKGKEARQRNVGHEFAPNDTSYTEVLPISPRDYPDIANVHYYIIEDYPPK
jgi:hypothetical protein